MKVCVIGLGRFGYEVATGLADNGVEVMAIDSNETIVASIKDNVTQAICMNVTDESVMRNVGIEEMETVVVAMAENFAESILLTALVKKRLGVKTVIARAINDIHSEILMLVGADRTILPEKEIGRRLADSLSSPFPDLVRLSKNFSVTPFKAPDRFVGRTINELDLSHHYQINCLGIKKDDSIITAHPEYVIMPGDQLVCAGSTNDLEEAAQE